VGLEKWWEGIVSFIGELFGSTVARGISWARTRREEGFEVRCSGKEEKGGKILSEVQECECGDEEDGCKREEMKN